MTTLCVVTHASTLRVASRVPRPAFRLTETRRGASKTCVPTQSVGTREEGTNTSIQAAHAGGAFVLRGDGSTKFLSESIGAGLLSGLAARDDGSVLSEY